MSAKKDFTNYYVDDDKELISRMSELYQENGSQWQQYFYEADVDARIYSGDRGCFDGIYGAGFGAPDQRSSELSFNMVRSRVNMIAGHQIRTRKTTAIVPQEPKDQQGADDLSGILQWANTRMGLYNNLSNAFKGSLITGMNLLGFWMDFTADPVNGEISNNVYSYNSFLIDPYWSKKDLSDCGYVWTRKWMDKSQLKILFPHEKDYIESMSYQGQRDGRFPYMPQNVNYSTQKLFPYDEFWYRDDKEEEVLLDNLTGETLKWRGSEEERQLFLRKFNNVQIIRRRVPTTKLGIVVGDKAFYNGPNIFGIDRYPFCPSVAYYQPDLPYFPSRVQGIVRDLRGCEWSFGRRMRLNLQFLESQINSGMKAEADSLVNPEDAFLSGAGRVLWVKKGRMDSVQPLPAAQIPPSWFQEIETLEGLYNKVSGVTDELLGASDTDTGITQLLRQGSGLTTLEPLFASLDETQEVCGDIVLELIQENWTLEKMERVLNRKLDPSISSKMFTKFDVNIVEGVLSKNQRQMQFYQLMELMKTGMKIPPHLLLETSDLQNKNDLVQALQKQDSEEQKKVQEQEQVQMKMLQTQINELNARAVANEGLGLERISRVSENKALAQERRAEAVKDLELATLNKVKALKELDSMDLENIEKMVNLINAMSQQEQQKADVAKREADQGNTGAA